MALIGMACYSTPENGRAAFTRQTLRCLADTVDWGRHRLFVVDNASTDPAAKSLYADAATWLPFTLVENTTNRGTARAVNQAWVRCRLGEHALKMDDDCVIHTSGWLDTMEECFARDPKLGIVAGKRPDLIEAPWREEEWWRSELIMLPHQPGQRWIVVEKVRHCIGTCTLFNRALLNKIGYLYQPGIYSHDDTLAAIRCVVAGFYSAFLCNYHIDHVDPGGTDFVTWKQDYAGQMMAKFNELQDAYLTGTKSVFHGPNDE